MSMGNIGVNQIKARPASLNGLCWKYDAPLYIENHFESQHASIIVSKPLVIYRKTSFIIVYVL